MKRIPLLPVGSGKVALVDDVDYPELFAYPWEARWNGWWYAVCTSSDGTTLLMHELVIGNDDGWWTYRTNGNVIDVRRRQIQYRTPPHISGPLESESAITCPSSGSIPSGMLDAGQCSNEYYLPDPPPAKKERANARRRSQKYTTRLRTAAAIRHGEIPHIKLMSCAMCGVSAKEYHHRSYDKPDSYLDVVALCVKCHNDIHLEMGGDANFFGKFRGRGSAQK